MPARAISRRPRAECADFPSQPDQAEATNHAKDRVGHSDSEIAAPDQAHPFKTESGEGGEAAEKTGDEEKPDV